MQRPNHSLIISNMVGKYFNDLHILKKYFIALVKTSKACISPYEKIGKQCLYFSRPYEPWGITKSWDQVGKNEGRDVEMYILENLFKIYVKAYKSFYGAAIFCLENGGFLAEQILDVEKALKFCKHLKGKIYFPYKVLSSILGSCTPSLIARKGRCYQWSPLDGLVINLKGHDNI